MSGYAALTRPTRARPGKPGSTEWKTRALGDVLVRTGTINPRLEQDKEFDYIDVSSVSNETFRIENAQRLKGRDAPSRATRLVRAGDVLFATVRPTLQRIAIVPSELDGQVCSTGYFVLRTDAQFDHRFVFYWLFTNSFTKQMAALQTGASYPAVTDRDVRTQRIPVPPLVEQQRIVAILDEAFASIAAARANAEQNLKNARALFESQLQSMFVRRKERWKTTTLGVETELLVGFAFKSARYTTGDKDIRLLRGDNIIQGHLRWDDVKRWPADDVAAYGRYRLWAGDVVLAMDRPWVKAGLKRATIFASDLPCLLVQRTACLRTKGNLDSRFLIHLISSEAFIQHILGVQTGIGVPHISGRQIKDFEFALPLLAEQRRIVHSLAAIGSETRRLESIYQRKLAALDELKQSLLARAFAGEL